MVTGKKRLIQNERTEDSSCSPQKIKEKPLTAAEELTIQDDPEEVGPIDDEVEETGNGILGEIDLYTA